MRFTKDGGGDYPNDVYAVNEPSIPLGELPKRWLEGKLPKISEIETENIRVGCEGRSFPPES